MDSRDNPLNLDVGHLQKLSFKTAKRMSNLYSYWRSDKMSICGKLGSRPWGL